MTACRLPCGHHQDYLARPAERLVIEGFRRWMTGCETASFAAWDVASNLYSEELGPSDAHRALGDLAAWVQALRTHMDRPAGCLPSGCGRLCRDECFAVTMIAAAQAGDHEALTLCLAGMVREEGADEACEAACAFATTLAALGQILLPVPAAVIADIAQRPRRACFH